MHGHQCTWRCLDRTNQHHVDHPLRISSVWWLHGAFTPTAFLLQQDARCVPTLPLQRLPSTRQLCVLWKWVALDRSAFAGAQSLLCGRCIQRSQGHLGAMGVTIHSRFCHHVAKSSRESIQQPALSGHTCHVCKNVHDPVHEELHARTPHDSTERAERALRLFRRLGHSFNGVAAWFDVMETVQCWQEILPQRIPAVLHGTPRAQDEDL